jgi:hypothetical protein
MTRRDDERYARLREIEAMDLEESCSRIWWLDMGYEFPWDFSVAGAIAFANSVAPPHMAALLVRTGELTENFERRMEHFALISLEMVRRGFRDPRGRAAVRQMNRIHKNAVKHISDENERWTIHNDEYLFTLATSTLIQARWVDRYGWRKLSRQEHLAGYLHMREQGEHMGLKNVPQTYEEFVRFHDRFVEENFRYSEEAAKLWEVLRPTVTGPMVGWLPERWQPLGLRLAEVAVPALITPHMRKAFGVREPSRLIRLAVNAALRLRAAYVRRQPPRTEAAYPDPLPTPSFPDGKFEMEKLGPVHTTGGTDVG